MVVSPGVVVSRAPWAQPRSDGFLGRGSAEQSVDEARRKAVATADAIQDVQLARRRLNGRPSTQATALQVWRCVEGTSRSVVATAFTDGNFALTSSIMPRKTAGSSAEVAFISGPRMPKPFWRSSSLPSRTSVWETMWPRISRASSEPPQMLQSFWR